MLLPQLPKPDWQPVPQYAEVDPHQPDDEQQLPKLLFKQVNLLVPPQVASVETLKVGVEEGGEDDEDGRVLVEVRSVEVDRIVVEGLLPGQVPKFGLHPVPQCPVEEPHHPYCEQQFPKLDPTQVYPLVPPHVPSVDGAALARPAESKAAATERRSFMGRSDDVSVSIQVGLRRLV